MGRLNGQCGASLACKSTTCRVIGSLCFEEGSGGRSRPMSKNDTPSDKNTWSSIQISDSKKKKKKKYDPKTQGNRTATGTMFKVMFHMIAQETREDNVKLTAVKPQRWL